eukprot:5791671-Pyramimonas_sp.AAC.1
MRMATRCGEGHIESVHGQHVGRPAENRSWQGGHGCGGMGLRGERPRDGIDFNNGVLEVSSGGEAPLDM